MNKSRDLSKKLFCFLSLIFTAFLLSGNIFAQFETATVLGAVQDSNGGAVQNATVTLKNIATSISNTTTTDSNGDYQFSNVKIGLYQIIVEAKGFNKTVADKIEATVNARQRVDLTLQVATATETVFITDAANPLQTDSSEVGQVVQRKQIVALPLNGRSYANLALLAPGVRESSTNSTIGGGGREAAFNVNGLRATFNNFLLDGIDNNAYGTSNQSFSSQVVQVSPDAIAEFKVQTNTYSAEFGRSGGAVINASYRSGTNQFHGSVWEFHRNKVLNATGFFKPIGGKPPLIRNQFGGVFGGPIIKDRTFFFGDYEGFRQIQKNLVYQNLPTLAQRQGILTVDVRNPLTGITYTAGTPIPMTAFAQKVLNELPAPNLTGVTGNNYQNLVLNQNFSDKYNIRIDHKINDTFSIFGRWSYRRSAEINAPNIEGASGGGNNGYVDVLNKQLMFGGTYAMTNGSVLDARFSYSDTNAGKRPVFIGKGTMLSLYGITGLSEDATVAGGLNTQTIGGLSGIGRQATNPQYQNPTNQDLRLSYSTLLSKHSLKLGYEYLRTNTDVQDTNPLYGLDTYSGQFSRVSGGANNLYNLADFMFGLRSQYEVANLTVAQMVQKFHFAYIQDDFKVNQRLTLNLGLRYEFGTPYYEKNNKLSNYDPTSNSIILAKSGSLYNRALVDPDYNNFGPRLGFAYNVMDKMVLRGGYGLGYV
ncbi:MAG TPA: TonB-dependent receptor, partial [Pyrinomonadaceae bacterium]|nr:TonB-dependent receptor [Pyrinomonadaceae bacterium]